MRNRRPAERSDAYFPQTGGMRAMSPAERLEPTRPPPRPRKRRFDGDGPQSRPLLRFLNGILTLALLVMLVLGGVAYVLDARFNAPGPLTASKTIVIPRGDGTQDIAARLEREGIVGDRRVFIAAYLWAKFSAWARNDRPVQLKAGDYEIGAAASAHHVVELLSEGKTIAYKVTIPEGLTSQQIVERLQADRNLTGEIATPPPEGSLLPETFIVQRGATRQSIIDSMTAASRKLLEKAWAQRQKGLPLKSPEEAVILASIVEKETGRSDERERVAAVFINRLRHKMRLQSDPTILYGLYGGNVAWGRAIQRQEILQKTSHNTYMIDGLPPTPICNPGRAAIEAVLNPADTKDLYFVATGSGGHAFAETLKDHNSNVLKWRAYERELKAKAEAAASAEKTPATSTLPVPVAPSPPSATAAPAAKPVPPKAKTRAVIRSVPKKAHGNKAKAAEPAPPADAAKEPAASSWASKTQAPAENKR
ncbi:MAG TPA: endolytic transglycosylase MltG [Hyphomicrobiaceae bacterium]|nr:endolytic transglycosylase MltG [Hyphomicrobiaceae bacterium]